MMQFDTNFWLFTPEEYEKLPDGIVLKSVNGYKHTKGKDRIQMDVKLGHIAYGIENPLEHEQAELFSVLMLSQ